MTAPAAIDIHRIEFPQRPRLSIPWAVRSSYAARNAMKAAGYRYDVAFYHTQTVALLAGRSSFASRYVVSVDATPKQMDSIGTWYNHRQGNGGLEAAKAWCYRRVFGRADGIVAWSQWAADSLINDYGVQPDRVLVKHPGAPEAFFSIGPRLEDRKPKILFVGGDFQRKGGEELLKSFERLSPFAELLVVSDADIRLPDGATQERGVSPGSSRLIQAYASADIFCLPTRADCTPIVLGEALAAGLPVVTTRVGSNSETVCEGTTGNLIDVGDVDALTETLGRLISDRTARRLMGDQARASAIAHFDASKNAREIFQFLQRIAS